LLCESLNLIFYIYLSDKHANVTWTEEEVLYCLMGQLTHLHVFHLLCLAWSTCLPAWLPLYLLYCSTVMSSLCLHVCQHIPSIWLTLSYITNSHCSLWPKTLHYWSSPSYVPFRIAFLWFHCISFYHVFREIEILATPSSFWSTGWLRPTSRGPNRGCLLSCYLSPS